MERCTYCMETVATGFPACSCERNVQFDSPIYLSPGTVLANRYQVGKVLGHGGFGITYLGWDLHLNIKIAIKEYFPRDLAVRAGNQLDLVAFTGAHASFEAGIQKFLEEAQHLAQFDDHPGIVSVRDFLKLNNSAYMVMNYVKGLTLKEYLQTLSEKRLPSEVAFQVMMPVMDALRALHGDYLLHRDVSPDNIYITNDKRVKLLDFGAARLALQEHSQNMSVLLKVEYAPIEQYQSKGNQGAWTDIYALGATLYEIITGTIPPRATDRLIDDPIQKPSSLGIAIKPSLENALMKALAVQAIDRFQTIEAFQEALELLTMFEIPTNQKKGKSQQKIVATPKASWIGYGKSKLALAGLLLLAIGWGGTGYLWNEDVATFANQLGSYKNSSEQVQNEQASTIQKLNQQLREASNEQKNALTSQRRTFMDVVNSYGGWWQFRYPEKRNIFGGRSEPEEFYHYYLVLDAGNKVGKGAIVKGYDWFGDFGKEWEVVYGFAKDSGIGYIHENALVYLGAGWRNSYRALSRELSGEFASEGYYFVEN